MKPVYVKILEKATIGVAWLCVSLVTALAHAEGYNSGPSGFNIGGYNNGGSSDNGYSGSYGYTVAPHRSDWMQKLQEQREYEEYLRKQYGAGNTAACGFTGAPSYCYTLVTKPRYPAEYRVVRY